MHQNVRIVLCEDNRVVRMTLARALQYKRGLALVGEASTVAELMALLAESTPDVLLMDVHMPGISGVDAIGMLRKLGYQMPVIIMSADPRNEGPAIDAGAAGFFYKGTADLSELVATIKSVLGVSADDRR